MYNDLLISFSDIETELTPSEYLPKNYKCSGECNKCKFFTFCEKGLFTPILPDVTELNFLDY